MEATLYFWNGLNETAASPHKGFKHFNELEPELQDKFDGIWKSCFSTLFVINTNDIK
ncbi:hypothetical protein [Levilactobacillus tongjiangensis]|uniref:hypothetical protein n=1 Tax=Levilactobacillus tongjiangensis TaxID=2486023 RepID=UPI0036D288F2